MPKPHNHISDSDFQSHLDGQPLTLAQQTHLATCNHCTMQLQLYRQTYAGLKQLPAPVLPFNLAHAVMQQMPHPATSAAVASSSATSLSENLGVLLTALVLLLSVGIAAYNGYFSTFTKLHIANALPLVPVLLAALITALLFQWIEYRFWNKQIVKL